MNIKRSRILPLLLSLLLLCSCDQPQSSLPVSEEEPKDSTLLGPTEDYGQEYLDRFVFFGESTTYHMKDRAVLLGGTDTLQVWGPDNGTVNLDATTPTLLLCYPDTGEHLTPAEAAEKKQPEYLVLCFGLNGAVQKVRQGEEAYQTCYRRLIDSLRAASPNTRIILQSAPPIAENMDMSRYTVSAEELNQCIDTLNRWTYALAEEEGLRYLNTAEILKDDAGMLRMDYQVGDGHHLTKEAYLAILTYIRTHGYQ